MNEFRFICARLILYERILKYTSVFIHLLKKSACSVVCVTSDVWLFLSYRIIICNSTLSWIMIVVMSVRKTVNCQ